MTQVSRMPLPKILQEQMHTALRKALADLHTEAEVSVFLDDLLTPTEKIMIAKRLAIAILLDRGYDQRTVHTIMKTSLTTVNQVNYWLKQKGKGYRIVLDKLKNDKDWREIKKDFEKFLKDFFSVRRQLRQKIPQEIRPRDTLL